MIQDKSRSGRSKKILGCFSSFLLHSLRATQTIKVLTSCSYWGDEGRFWDNPTPSDEKFLLKEWNNSVDTHLQNWKKIEEFCEYFNCSKNSY